MSTFETLLLDSKEYTFTEIAQHIADSGNISFDDALRVILAAVDSGELLQTHLVYRPNVFVEIFKAAARWAIYDIECCTPFDCGNGLTFTPQPINLRRWIANLLGINFGDAMETDGTEYTFGYGYPFKKALEDGIASSLIDWKEQTRLFLDDCGILNTKLFDAASTIIDCKLSKTNGRNIRGWLSKFNINHSLFNPAEPAQESSAIQADASVEPAIEQTTEASMRKNNRQRIRLKESCLNALFASLDDTVDKWRGWQKTNSYLNENQDLILYVKEVCEIKLSNPAIARHLETSRQNVENWYKEAKTLRVTQGEYRANKHLYTD